MLLKLIPARQEPTIHFSISFAELPANIPPPSSWTAQLAHLMREDLEVPATLHSLDRAAGIPSLLEEVALDLGMKEVRCRYIDGAIERLDFGLNGETRGVKLTEALEEIVRIVKESSMEDERIVKDQMQEQENQRSRSMSVSAVTAGFSSKPTGKIGKHKKQRSLFMHLVSCVGSIVNLTSPSTTSFSLRPSARNASSLSGNTPNTNSASASTKNTPAVFAPPAPGTSPRARILRRAARSALVDTFRRFVIGELATRFYIGPGYDVVRQGGSEQEYRHAYHHYRERGGFCVWILHSMRRRALERMEQIMEAAGSPGQVISFVQEVYPRAVRFSEESNGHELRTTTMDVPLSFSDEEDEGEETQSGITAEGEASVETGSENSTSETTVDGDTSQNTSTPYPTRPGKFWRRSSSSRSSDSVSTNGSSHSATSSYDSTSTTSTDATSVESESSGKEPESPPIPPKDFLVPIFQQEPRPQPMNEFKEMHHPPMHHLPLADQHEYSQLLELRIRLGELVQFTASQTRVAAEEARNRLEVLAVRSRRRAWLNKALNNPPVQSGSKSAGRPGAGASMYGFATPFRSSPLATYVWTAADQARRMSAISRGSTSSTSSLSSAYFRSVSSTSSASSSVSKRSSSRPRIRPRIDYEAALAAAVVELGSRSSNDTDSAQSDNAVDMGPDGNYEQPQSKLMDCELEVFGHADEPLRSRKRHRRQMQDAPALCPTPPGGKLFPVTEDRDEFTLAIRGRGKSREQEKFSKRSRTFMGCDEIRVETHDSEDDRMEGKEHMEFGYGFPLQMYPRNDRIFRQHMEDTMPSDVDMDQMDAETEMGMELAPAGMHKPKNLPRARTNSMIGVLLRGAKGVQRTLGGASKLQQPKVQYMLRSPSSTSLPGDSLLCQPVTIPTQPSPTSEQPNASLPADIPQPSHAPNRRAADVSRVPPSAIYTNIEVGIDVEMDIQIRVGDADSMHLPFHLPLSSKAPHLNTNTPAESGTVEQSSPLPQVQEQTEFTLAMDVRRVPRSGVGRKRPNYQIIHRSSHLDYAGNRRPKLDGIFDNSQVQSPDLSMSEQGL